MSEAEELVSCIIEVNDFFQGDRKKTALWFHTPNPLFGGIRPWELVLLGRTAKLIKFVRHQLLENEK